MPDSYAQSPDGLLLIANGIDSVLRWDGFAAEAEAAGVVAPTQTVSLAAADTGTITGDYYAYVRYMDRYGNVSDLSPIAGPVTAQSNATIHYSGIPTPTQARVA